MLNELTIDEMRREVEFFLEIIPDGEKIKIDKEILDNLIFFKGETVDGMIIKVPVWTGKFLRKIDLSELSFENTLLMVNGNIKEILKEKDLLKFYDEMISNAIYDLRNFKINFSKTNIMVDFSKLYDYSVENCDFSGVDLSGSNGEYLKMILHSDFSDTGIKLSFDKGNLILFFNDFSNNDFSEYVVNVLDFGSRYISLRSRYNGNDFSNTGLNIKYDVSSINKNNRNAIKKTLADLLNEKGLVHCYLNGKYILSQEELYMKRETKKKELEYKRKLSLKSNFKINLRNFKVDSDVKKFGNIKLSNKIRKLRKGKISSK